MNPSCSESMSRADVLRQFRKTLIETVAVETQTDIPYTAGDGLRTQLQCAVIELKRVRDLLFIECEAHKRTTVGLAELETMRAQSRVDNEELRTLKMRLIGFTRRTATIPIVSPTNPVMQIGT